MTITHVPFTSSDGHNFPRLVEAAVPGVAAMVEDIGLQGTLDHGTFDLLDETVSGHTLKHLSTAAAACMALPMLRNPVLFSFSLEHFSPWPVERDRS